MKRKILIFLLFIFVGFFAAGCDFFGGNQTLPITLPESSTTETGEQSSTTTTIQSNSSSTITTVITSGESSSSTTQQTTSTTQQSTTTTEQQTTTTTTVEQTTTTTTEEQTTTTTTEEQTTTTTTEEQTTTTTTEEQTTTTTTEQGTYYNVTFIDWDGSVITSMSVLEYNDATPPADPTRTGYLNYIYVFTGWDKSFTMVQSDLTIQATYELQYSSQSDYTHENLLMLIATMYQSTDEAYLEEEIDMMISMTGALSEHELYDMMIIVDKLVTGLPNVTDAADFHSLMSYVTTLGLNGEMVANVGFNMMNGAMTSELAFYQEEIIYYQTRITNAQEALDEIPSKIAIIDQEVADYCNGPAAMYATECLAYYNQVKTLIDLDTNHQFLTRKLYEYEIDEWDYKDMADMYRDYYYYTNIDVDPYQAGQAYQDYQEILSYYDSSQQAYLTSIFETYELYLNAEAVFLDTDFSAIENYDTNGDYIISMLFNYLYNGWTNDQYEYEYSYQNLLYNKADYETTIQELTNRIQEMNQEILMMTDIMALMADPEMEEDIKLVIEMVYDGFYAMLGEIDQEMFDFMMSMMMFNDYYVVPKEMMSVQMDTGMGMLSGMLSSLSPEKVTYLLNSLGDMMLAFEATMTLEEKTLIADMLINIMPYMIDDDSLTETMIANLVNHFLPMVFNAGDDIASFLSTMTVQKTQAIIELVTIIAISDDNDQALINLAQTLDVVFGDGSLDLQTLAGTVYELYTVMTYGANAPIDVTTENAIKGNIGNILSLAADINLMNPSALTEADFLILDEFELRLFALLEGLMTEFDNMPTDFTVVYDTQDFLDLIYDMGFDGTIEDFKTLFQVSDEEDAYYLTRALYNYMNSFISIRNFSDIQNFFAGIDQFGLTESQAIDIAIILLKDIVYEELNGLSGDEEYYQDMIDYHTVYLNEEIANMTIYEQEILDFIGSLDVSKQAISTEFWQKWKNFLQHEYEYNAYMDILYVKIDYYLLDDIENVLINMSYLDPSDPNYALDMQAYEDEYIYCLNEIDSAYHGDIDHLRYLFETRDLAYKEYIEFEATYYGTDYEYIFWEIDDMGYDSWVYSAQEYYHNAAWIQYYQFLLNNTSAYVNYELEAFMDLLNNDPDLFKGLVIILLDDMQNVTATMSADSFMEIYDFIFFMQAPHGVYPDFNAEDILALTQDISSFLKLIGNTIDLTDEASINTVISTYLGYYADKMGLTETEKDAFIAKISTVIVKYRAHADDIIDQMVLFLDALTLEEINQIIDFAHDVYSGRLNEIEMAVLGAGLFEDLFNVTGLDLTVMINAYVELRMDVENDFVFDSTILQSEFTSFYDSTKTLIGQVAAIDLNNITTGNIASVIELVDRLQHFGMYFGNPTLILDGYSYSYDSSDFHDLLVMIFNATETEVPFIITEITTMLGLDEEQSYYKVLGIAMVLRDFENVQSLSDIARIYDGLRSMGLTNADIAKYGMSIVMGMVYPNLPADFDTQPYYDENVTLTNNIDNLDLQLDNLESVLMDEVDLLDPSIQDEVMQVWNLYMPIVDKVFDREMYINAYKYNHYYDENLFYQLLVPEYYASNWGYIHEIYDMYRLSEEEVMFYEGLYYQYHYYIVMDYDYSLSVYNSFANVYYDLYDSTGTQLFSNLLKSTIDSYFDLTIQKAGVVSTYNNNLDTIMQIEENGVILEVIYNYLSDPANQVVAEQVLTMLLDEFEVMKDSDSFLAMSDVLGMMQEGYMIYDLINPEFLADNVGHLSTLLGLMGSTIDFNDQIVLTGFFKEVLTTYVETKDLDPTAEAAMIAEYDNIVITYLPMLLNIPDKLSSFLATMDEAKISKVLSIIKMIDWTNYSDNGDLQRMVLVGTLIDTVFANDTLDYDYLVTQIYGLIYDVSLIEQMPIPISVDKQAEIQAIITSLDNLLVQAALVADIGIFGIDTQDIIAINDFIAVLESIFYVEQTPVY